MGKLFPSITPEVNLIIMKKEEITGAWKESLAIML